PGLLERPVDLVFALGGEGAVDPVLVDLVRAADDLEALGQRPGAQGVAHVVQFGHEAGVVGNRNAAGLGLDVLDGSSFGDLDFQRFAGGHDRGQGIDGERQLAVIVAVLVVLALVGLGGRLVLCGLVVGLVRVGAGPGLLHGLGDIEGVGLAAKFGGDDAHRAGGDEAIGIHRALDPLHVGLHRALDLLVVALDRAGLDDQQVLGGTLQVGHAAQLAALDGVVDVRDAGQHVGDALQAKLHVVADMTADVQAGVAADQVPAVLDVIGLGDLDVALDRASPGGGEPEFGELVVAALVVLDGELDALAGHRFDDLPAAVAHLADVGIPGQLRADTGSGAGKLELGLRVAQYQRVPVLEAAQAVDRVEHDRHLAIGFDAFAEVAAGRQDDAHDQHQGSNDRERNQDLDETGHSGFSRTISGRAGRRPAILAI